MAIALPNIRRDSTSYNPNKTIGVAFPLDDKNMFFGTLTAKQQAKANLLNCLLTFPGERLMLPEFGVGLKKLLFEQNIDLDNLEMLIKTQVARFVPNISIANVAVNKADDSETLNVLVVYRNLIDNTGDAIQVNFGDVITPEYSI
tara:strand:- start:8108 stop:8542 length:435 start_codon:yes stop_codon:yes gene_type:complete